MWAAAIGGRSALKGFGTHSSPAYITEIMLCRCQAEHDSDEQLVGNVASIVLWNSPLDFIALRMALHRGVPSTLTMLRDTNPAYTVVFALPSMGCLSK